MSSDNLPALFEGKEIRTVECDGEPWFPLVDLGDAWGLARNTFNKIVSRNDEAFAGYTRLMDVTYPREIRPDSQNLNDKLVCVNERGMYLLIGKVSIDRLKNPDARERILRFQRWVPELIQKYRKKEIVQAPIATALDIELQQARRIAELTGTDLKTMQAAALRKCGLPEYAEALAAPALIHGESGVWLNATQIGTRCSHSAQEINNYLSFHRFQYRDQTGVWRLTDKGEPHGEEYWFESASKHREVRIRWRESIMVASGLIKEIPGQTALPAHA